MNLFLSLIFSLAIFSSQSEKESYIAFFIKNAGITVEGEFTDFSHEIKLLNTEAKNRVFKGEIRVKSIKTGIAKRDRDLLKSSYFDEENHPKITFKSTKIEQVSDDQFTVTGMINIKDTSKEISFDVQVDKKNLHYTFELELNRRDFEVGGSSLMLSDNLKAKIKIVDP